MAYTEEIAEADRKYQKEPTLANELALEKAKLNYWLEEQQKKPGDKDVESRVNYHRAEVIRMEGEAKMA